VSIRSLRVFCVTAIAVFAPLSNVALADTVTYLFTMNTSSENGTTGFIDMQFSELSFPPGPGVYNTNATATVSNFQTDGTLAVEDPYTTPAPAGGNLASGDVTGTLTNPVVFTVDGDGATNDYEQQITFGNQLSFDLTLEGQGVTTPICPGTAGSECSFPDFILDFLNSGETGFLFSNDPSGSTPSGWVIGGVNVNADTSTSPFTNPGPDNGSSFLTISAVSSVPEPSQFLVLTGAFIGIVAFACRRSRIAV